MNRRQRRRKASRNAHQLQTPQAPKVNLQDAALGNPGKAKSGSSGDLDSREVPVILLLAFLSVVPICAVLATNTMPYYEYVLNADKRAGVFSYASFWLSAAAALAAGRGVLRSKTAEASMFKDSDYYWEGAIFLFAAAVCAALAVSDHPSTPKLLFWLFVALAIAQVGLSRIALSRLQTVERRRALLRRVPLFLLLLAGLGVYGYIVFVFAPP